MFKYFFQTLSISFSQKAPFIFSYLSIKSIKLSSKEYILGKSMNFKFFIFLKFSSFKSIKQSNNKGIE